MMNRRYIGDAELADRMSRFIIAFPYALMALLRGSSLGEEGGHGGQKLLTFSIGFEQLAVRKYFRNAT